MFRPETPNASIKPDYLGCKLRHLRPSRVGDISFGMIALKTQRPAFECSMPPGRPGIMLGTCWFPHGTVEYVHDRDKEHIIA